MEHDELPTSEQLGSSAIICVGTIIKDGKRKTSLTVEGDLLEFAGLEPGMPVIAWASYGSLYIDRLSNEIQMDK